MIRHLYLRIHQFLRKFVETEASSSIVLGLFAITALVVVNGGYHQTYQEFLNWQLNLDLNIAHIDKPLLLWVNDGLMAIFFFIIGLELKRELIEGHLSKPRHVALPAFGAVGGILAPALIFAAFNMSDEIAMRGWAIPTATDIAFSLGVLMLLGRRVPVGLKIFLLALAILDDLAAVLIIALYYTDQLALDMIVNAGLCMVALIIFNLLRVRHTPLYMLVGLVLWYFTLKSGVHATIAGVLLAATIPTHVPHDMQYSPLTRLEHKLHGWVAFLILPIFAFCNAGVYVMDATWSVLTDELTLGILLGLLLGKPIGICLFTALGAALKLGSLPHGTGWLAFVGMSFLCGIGFTMSLFVASLAHGDYAHLITEDKIGILLGSVVSAVIGYMILHRALRPYPPKQLDDV